MLDMICSQPLSQGAYGRVSNSWIPNVVIKTAPYDPAWAYWAAFCIQFQDESPYLPRIYKLNCNPEGHFLTAVMEELEHGAGPHIQLPLFSDWEQNVLLDQLLPPIRDIFALFLSFVGSETDPDDRFRFDGHSDNWMFRQDQMVMTDPVAGALKYKNPPLFNHPRITIE